MKEIMNSLSQIQKNPDYQKRIGPGTLSMLSRASINIGSDRKSLLLSFDSSMEGKMGFQQLSKEEHRMELQDAIGEITGKKVEIVCQVKEDLSESDLGNINLSKVKFDIQIED